VLVTAVSGTTLTVWPVDGTVPELPDTVGHPADEALEQAEPDASDGPGTAEGGWQ
jgi:hypothetical protein